MRLFVFMFLAATACTLAPVSAAPISLKEVEFLVRQRTPEASIISEVSERRLLAPLNPQAAAKLQEMGATAELIKQLSEPGMVADPETSRSALAMQEMQRRKLREEQIADAQAHKALEEQRARLSDKILSAGAARALFEGKLVKLDGDQLKPVSANELESVRVFAIFYGALSNAPSRQLARQLVPIYRNFKEKYPEFELIYVSRDADEFNMMTFMRDNKMPWPAVPPGKPDPGIDQFAGEPLPWLVAISDSAQPLTTNAKDKKYVDPDQVLRGIDYLLKQMAPNR